MSSEQNFNGWMLWWWWVNKGVLIPQWAGSYLAMYPIHSGVSSIYSDFIHCRTERWAEKAALGWGGSSCPWQTHGDTHTLKLSNTIKVYSSCQCCWRDLEFVPILQCRLCLYVDLVFATHFAADCACGSPWKFLWWLLWKQWLQPAMPHAAHLN